MLRKPFIIVLLSFSFTSCSGILKGFARFGDDMAKFVGKSVDDVPLPRLDIDYIIEEQIKSPHEAYDAYDAVNRAVEDYQKKYSE